MERKAKAANALVSPSSTDDGAVNGDAAYEATIVANLHAQAAGVQNIRTLVPIVLDPTSTHYDRWHDLVLLVLERYAEASPNKRRLKSDTISVPGG